MPFNDRSTNLDLNGPNIEVKTQAYGHEEGSTTAKTTVNPFGADASRTGGTIEITGIGTASWPVGYSTYASNTGSIGYQWYRVNADGSTDKLGISTRYEGHTSDTIKLKYLDSPEDNGKQYYVQTYIVPSAYAQPEGSTVTAGTARSTGYAINETVDTDKVTVTVLPELTLDTQPTDQSATVNNNAEFNTSASVTDDSTISYQWYIDGNKITSSPIYSTNFAQVRKERYALNTTNGRDNSITIPDDATNVKIRIGAGAGGYGGSDTNGGGGAGGYGRVGYFTLPDGGRTLTIRVGQRGSQGQSGRNADGGRGGLVTDEGDGGVGGSAPDSGAGGGGSAGCYVYDGLSSSWILAAGGGGGGGGGSWNVGGNSGGNGGDWQAVEGDLGRNTTCNGARGQTRSTNNVTTGPTSTQVRFDFAVIGTLQNAYFRLRAPGRPYDFTRNINGSVTKDIPFGIRDEVHIHPGGTAGVGHIRFENNWRTMKWWKGYRSIARTPNIMVTCSTGKFLSTGRSLNVSYNYRYPNFVPTIDWGHDKTTVITVSYTHLRAHET